MNESQTPRKRSHSGNTLRILEPPGESEVYSSHIIKITHMTRYYCQSQENDVQWVDTPCSFLRESEAESETEMKDMTVCHLNSKQRLKDRVG